MENSNKNSLKNIACCLLFLSLFYSCKELGLIEIPKYMGDKKWGNSKDDSRFVIVDDLKIHYRDQGKRDAPAIIAIHGIADSLHVWEAMANHLK